MTKRTKIVCTIGPASHSLQTLLALGRAGMDVARLNFSHGTHAEHRVLFDRLNQAGKTLGRPFGILQDLQGPKIRVGELPKEGIQLVAGRRAVFSTAVKPEEGDIPVTLPSLHEDVNLRERILLDDGLLEVEVRRVEGRRIITEVLQGGTLTSHKGLNLPGTALRIPALSKKDREDAIFGASLGVDFVALSFVRSPKDVKELRRLLDAQGAKGKAIQIIAKIEKREAVDRFEEILPLVDGVMVARGDLGIEVPADQVPVIQKRLVARCREAGVPVIVATQMLDSMIRNPRATRAEISDVANAVVDHADAVMLSGETASGAFPIEAVKTMAQTIRTMEASAFDDMTRLSVDASHDVRHALGVSVRLLVDTLEKPPVIVTTVSGQTAKDVASKRPETAICAYTFDPHVARVLRLVWGIESCVIAQKKTADQRLVFALQDLQKKKLLKKGQSVIVVAGAGTLPRTFSKRVDILSV